MASSIRETRTSTSCSSSSLRMSASRSLSHRPFRLTAHMPGAEVMPRCPGVGTSSSGRKSTRIGSVLESPIHSSLTVFLPLLEGLQTRGSGGHSLCKQPARPVVLRCNRKTIIDSQLLEVVPASLRRQHLWPEGIRGVFKAPLNVLQTNALPLLAPCRQSSSLP